MKKIIAIVCILILIVCISICGCSVNNELKNQEQTVENLLQDYNSNPEVLKEYEGKYSFDEIVTLSESNYFKNTLFHGFVINIYFEQGICYADIAEMYGYSRHEYKALVTENSKGISLWFMESLYLDDGPDPQRESKTRPKLNTYKVGEELLRLEKNGDKYETYWVKLQPVLEESRTRTDCFERIITPNNTASEETQTKILELVDNETPASELLTEISDSPVPPSIKYFFDPLYAVPQCIRYSNENIYTITKTSLGYIIRFYGKLDTSEFRTGSWIISQKTYLKDYEELYHEKAPYDVVRERVGDGYKGGGWYEEALDFPTSTHYSADGYKIVFDYEPRGDFKIRTMKVHSGEENETYYNLLPIDRELLTK